MVVMEIIENVTRSQQIIKLSEAPIQAIAETSAHRGKSFQPQVIEIERSSEDPDGAKVRVSGLLVRQDGTLGKNTGYAFYTIGNLEFSQAPSAPQWITDILDAI